MLALALAAAFFFPGQVLADEPVVGRSVRVAYDYWIARGEQPCTPDSVTVYMAPDLGKSEGLPAIGWAQRETCMVWLLTSSVQYAVWYPRWTPDTVDLCTTVVHEVGHLAGLGHVNDGGVMDAVQTGRGRNAPDECRRLARIRRAASLRRALPFIAAQTGRLRR